MFTRKKKYIFFGFILLLLSALSVSFIMLTNNNISHNANAAAGISVGSVVSVGGGGRGPAGEAWFLVNIPISDEDSAASAAFDAASAKGITGWKGNNRSFVNLKKAIKEAVGLCHIDASTKCENPVLVAWGTKTWGGVDSDGKLCPTTWCISHNGSMNITGQQSWGDGASVPGSGLSVTEKLYYQNGQASINDLARAGTTKIAIVIDKSQIEPQKGWYPEYEPKTFDGYTSTVRIDSHELDPCPYEYRMSAQGLDGYIRGWNLNPQVYKTEYGKLWDTVASGNYGRGKGYDFNYNPENSNNDGTAFKPSYKGETLDSTNEKLLADYLKTCEAAYKQVDNWNIEEQNGKINTEVDNHEPKNDFTGKDFLNQYSKGGIYKVKRERRDAQINYKTTEVEYYHATGTYYVFKGWKECKKGEKHDNGMGEQVECDHIGQPAPAAITGKFKETSVDNLIWTRIEKQEAQDAAEYYDPGKPGHGPKDFAKGAFIIPDKDIRIYNYGYRGLDGKFHAKDEIVGYFESSPSGSTYDNIKTCNQDKCSETFSMHWTYGGAKDDFLKWGFPSDTIDQQIAPVRQEQQSWKHVWHQDFLNVLCNLNDLNKYIEKLDENGVTGYDVTTSGVDNNKKYQAQIIGPIVDSKYAETHYQTEIDKIKSELSSGWNKPGSVETDGHAAQGQYNATTPAWDLIAKDMAAGSHEEFDRFTQTVTLREVVDPRGINTNAHDMQGKLNTEYSNYGDFKCFLPNKMKNFLGKEVGAADNSADGYSAICNSDYSWYTSPSYNAKYDPVYTKECPWDCTSVASETSSGSASVKNNVRDGKTNASSDAGALKTNAQDVADGNIGVRIRPSDVKGGMPSDSSQMANSSNMTFFRNNAWNNFTTDIFVPMLGSEPAEEGTLTQNDGAKDSWTGETTHKTSSAKTTTIVRNNGTPWFIAARKPNTGVATYMKALQDGILTDANSGKAIKMYDYNYDDATIKAHNLRLPNQISNLTDAAASLISSTDISNDSTSYTEKLAGEYNSFSIKSNWATDSNIGNLRFNIKWEYDVKTRVVIQSKFTATGAHSSMNGNPELTDGKNKVAAEDTNGITSGISGTANYYAVADGNCYAQQGNKSTKGGIADYPDMTDFFHDTTGAGVKDDVDGKYRGEGSPNDNIDNAFNTQNLIGHFTIQFVRASAE